LKSPRDRKVYYEFATHGSVMHRARESGAYVIQFFNPTEHPVRVNYQYDALTFGGSDSLFRADNPLPGLNI
jgi:hypothetical protein